MPEISKEMIPLLVAALLVGAVGAFAFVKFAGKPCNCND